MSKKYKLYEVYCNGWLCYKIIEKAIFSGKTHYRLEDNFGERTNYLTNAQMSETLKNYKKELK